MKKLLLPLLLAAGALFGQVQENAQINENLAVSVGRNRNGIEDQVLGKHNLVQTVHRRPTGACSADEAQIELNLLTSEDARETGEIAVLLKQHPGMWLNEAQAFVDLQFRGQRPRQLCWQTISADYTMNLVTNAGLNWAADILGNTSTPSVNAQCNYIALTNTAITPAAGDTTLSGEISSNGLSRAQATYAHTSNATTFTLSKTFTATGTQSAQAGGVFTAASVGTMCYEDTFTSASLVSGDTLAVTWTITI